MFNDRARRIIISRKLRIGPKSKRGKCRIDINLIADNLDFGDWKLLYHLLRNMDSLVFMEFCEHLTDLLHKEAEKMNGMDDTMKLKDLLGEDDNKDNLNKSSLDGGSFGMGEIKKEDDFLNFNDGNYLVKPSHGGSSKESQI